MSCLGLSRAALQLGIGAFFSIVNVGYDACVWGQEQYPPGTAPAPAAPTSASIEAKHELYMPDGQLNSHALRVYLPIDIDLKQKPRLELWRSHAVIAKKLEATLAPILVAPGQVWSNTVNGQNIVKSGTLLMFDISNVNFGYKAMVRVLPILKWGEEAEQQVAVGANEVNVGNFVAAVAWTALIVGLTLIVLSALAWVAGRGPFLLLSGIDGHLSLAQTQIACWTIAIGCIVLGYGLIRLTVPEIPASLLALMGASLATGGIAFFHDDRNQSEAIKRGIFPIARGMQWRDLVRNFPTGGPPELSLAKSQMLFWTVLLLVLFVSKSILEGAIWNIPWPLVALMGFSQASYLAPKIANTT